MLQQAVEAPKAGICETSAEAVGVRGSQGAAGLSPLQPLRQMHPVGHGSRLRRRLPPGWLVLWEAEVGSETASPAVLPLAGM